MAGQYLAPVFHGENLISFPVVDSKLKRIETSEGFVLMDRAWSVQKD